MRISAKGRYALAAGYQLARMPRQITLLDVLSAVELSLIEPTEETVLEKAPEIGEAMRLAAFKKINDTLKNVMENITLEDLVTEAQKHKTDSGYMYYI